MLEVSVVKMYPSQLDIFNYITNMDKITVETEYTPFLRIVESGQLKSNILTDWFLALLF